MNTVDPGSIPVAAGAVITVVVFGILGALEWYRKFWEGRGR